MGMDASDVCWLLGRDPPSGGSGGTADVGAGPWRAGVLPAAPSPPALLMAVDFEGVAGV